MVELVGGDLGDSPPGFLLKLGERKDLADLESASETGNAVAGGTPGGFLDIFDYPGLETCQRGQVRGAAKRAVAPASKPGILTARRVSPSSAATAFCVSALRVSNP